MQKDVNQIYLSPLYLYIY